MCTFYQSANSGRKDFRCTHFSRDHLLTCSCFVTGVGSSNNYAYLVVDDKSKDAVIIDPANPPE